MWDRFRNVHSNLPIQTDASNASRRYLVGKSEIIDGLKSSSHFIPESTKATRPSRWRMGLPSVCTTLPMGEGYRSVVWSSLGLVGRIELIETLIPRNSAALDGVHLVELELVKLSRNYEELAVVSMASRTALFMGGDRN